MKPRAVGFDLDGTLALSKQALQPHMGELLEKLLERMPVAVLSGASFKQFERELLSHLPQGVHLESLYLFPANASQCYSYSSDSWNTMYNAVLSSDERHKVRNALASILIEEDIENPPEKIWGERVEDRGSQITYSGLGQSAPLEAKERWDPDGVRRLHMVEKLRPLLPGFSVTLGGTTTIDITRAGYTKGYGMRRFSEL